MGRIFESNGSAPLVFSERLEGRFLLSTGFEVAAEVSGQTPVRLVPVEAVAPGAVTRVAFGVPFPKGFVPAADLSRVRLLDAGGAERAAHVGLLSPWRDMAALADLPSARSVLVQADVAFPDADGDGDADPLEGWSVQWGTTARTLAPPAPLADVRSNWVRYDNAAAPAGTDYKAADNVSEPPAYALFTPDWYGRSLLKTRLLPAGSDPAFAGYDAAYANFAATAVNDVDPRVAEANLIRYTTTDEPWLFDRATAFFQLAFRTGDVAYLREGHRAAQFYANHVSPQGFFDLKGDDLKYVTGEAVATDYWLTGDGRLPDVHRRMNPVFDHGQNAAYTPGHFWTERHAAAKLMGYVTGYELLGDAALGQKARDTFTIYVNHQNNPPAGAPNTGLLMHLKPDHGEGGTNEWVASPWMTVLLADAVERYYLHSDDARVPAFVTRLADGLDAVGDSVYYSDDVDGVSRLMPYYLAGPGLSESQHEFDPFGDFEHAVDVSKIFALAYYFTRRAGTPNPAYLGRFNELQDTAQSAFNYWTRPNGPASGLSVYRLSPARKFNWWFRTTANRDFLIGGDAPVPPDTEDPSAVISVPNLNTAGGAFYTFTVTYTDNRSIDVSTIDSNDLRVTGVNGFDQLASLVSVSPNTDGTPRVATYRLDAPGGTWDAADDGGYGVDMRPNQVADTAGQFVPAGFLASFTVATAGGLSITNVAASGITAGGATITWTTDVPADTQVQYGTTSAYGSTTPLVSSLVTAHTMALSGLSPNTLYHYRVLSRRSGGTLFNSSDFTFTTVASNGGGPGFLGEFGRVGDRTAKLTFTSPEGTAVTASLAGGGTGQAYLDGSGRIRINVTGTTPRSALAFKTKGGNGRVTLGDVRTDGPMKAITGKTADLAGTLAAGGPIGSATLGSISGGVVAADGDIKRLSVGAGSSSARVMAGMDLGADGLMGGTGGDADVVGSGSIRTLKLMTTEGDATVVTASLKGAGAVQISAGSGGVSLDVTGTGPASSLAFKAKGGDGRVVLDDVVVAGALKAFTAKTADLAGALSFGGPVGSVLLGSLAGGTVAVAGDVDAVTVAGASDNARVLAGVRLGSDNQLGGTGGAVDTGVGGSIRKLSLGGPVAGSVFAAGVLPGPNGTFGDGDDVLTGGAGSGILSIAARGTVDAASRFEAGAFGKTKIGGASPDPASDPRFLLLA